MVTWTAKTTMDSILSVLATIAIIFGVVMLFNFMIFIHELGHFFAARWRGLYVDRFQIWFGRPIWKKTVNGVQWGLGWIPAGGFVSLPHQPSSCPCSHNLLHSDVHHHVSRFGSLQHY